MDYQRVLKRYDDNYCVGCERSERVVFTMPTDLAAGFPVHQPSGMICTKYVQPYYVKGKDDLTG